MILTDQSNLTLRTGNGLRALDPFRGSQRSELRNSVNAEHRAVFPATHCPWCPQHGPPSVLPSPLARQLHYLKHTLVFICGADDVAPSSTFPSPAVYIREPIWRYKIRQQEGGGPEPERRALEAILQSSGLLANLVSCVVSYVAECERRFRLIFVSVLSFD